MERTAKCLESLRYTPVKKSIDDYLVSSAEVDNEFFSAKTLCRLVARGGLLCNAGIWVTRNLTSLWNSLPSSWINKKVVGAMSSSLTKAKEAIPGRPC